MRRLARASVFMGRGKKRGGGSGEGGEEVKRGWFKIRAHYTVYLRLELRTG